MALGTVVGEHQGWNTYQRGGSGAVTWPRGQERRLPGGVDSARRILGEQGGMEQVAGEGDYTFAELLTGCVSRLR